MLNIWRRAAKLNENQRATIGTKGNTSVRYAAVEKALEVSPFLT